jgi:hypothetical protein
MIHSLGLLTRFATFIIDGAVFDLDGSYFRCRSGDAAIGRDSIQGTCPYRRFFSGCRPH